MRTRGWACRRVFGAGLGAALAFGRAQAMASPADAVRHEARGAISGRCTSTGLCACLW